MEHKTMDTIETVKRKLHRLAFLFNHFKDLRDFHYKKFHTVGIDKNIDYHYRQYELYNSLTTRASSLAYRLKRQLTPKHIMKIVEKEFVQSEYKYWLKKKADGKAAHQTKHKYEPWFLGTSLEADYGTFTCDKCNRKFYHSPATITFAGKTIYNCCCGHCTNIIMVQDWGEEPYF